MKIVWDEPKRLANVAKHGLDFADLDEDFFANSVIVPGKAGRLIAVGRSAAGDILVVLPCWAVKPSALSACDMRAAGKGD